MYAKTQQDLISAKREVKNLKGSSFIPIMKNPSP